MGSARSSVTVVILPTSRESFALFGSRGASCGPRRARTGALPATGRNAAARASLGERPPQPSRRAGASGGARRKPSPSRHRARTGPASQTRLTRSSLQRLLGGDEGIYNLLRIPHGRVTFGVALAFLAPPPFPRS